MSSTFREIEKGPTFEVYRSPRCVQRLDWRSDGSLQVRYAGYMEAACAKPIIQRWEIALRTNKSFPIFHDTWEATGFDSAWRVELADWVSQHKTAISMCHVLTRSKVMHMLVSVLSLAFPGQLTSYSKRTDFDILVKKAGLPVAPAMPALDSPVSPGV